MSTTDLARTTPVETHLAEMMRRWVFDWERTGPDEVFDFRTTFAEHYDFDAPEGVFYDDMAPDHRVARSVDAYGALFEPFFNALRSARHTIAEEPSFVLGEDLAACRLVFVAHIVDGEGEAIGLRTTCTLVLRPRPQGWRIVREHNSSQRIPADEADAVVRAATGR